MKLLVHCNEVMAKRAIELLELDPKEWQAGYYNQPMLETFDKIVVIMWKSEMTYSTEQWFEESLSLRVSSPDIRVEFL